MNFRKAKISDFDSCMKLYENGREYMRLNGNVSQWVNGYPSDELVAQDIKEGGLYLCEDGEMPKAVFYLGFEHEPTYNLIYNGKWTNNRPYVVIHRIAVDNDSHRKGICSNCFDFALKEAKKRDILNIRIDTHKDNVPMQGTVLKYGFSYCGIIYIEDGSERLAYQFENLCSR
ncbi:MAG: GNAT family N-acetyltransferase [Bacillota bacterium]|nr:GNAT family N-acetyltransferase [Bacillota bacterium]